MLAAAAVLACGCCASVRADGHEAPGAALDGTAAAPFGMPVEDQALFAHALFDELEGELGSSRPPYRWDGEGWIGNDSHRLWLKTEGILSHGTVSGGDHELLYDRPVRSFWDVQVGLRYDLDSYGSRGWAAIGVEGLAPQFIHLSATVYASDGGHLATKLIASYEEIITQRVVLEPRIELNVYSRPDALRDVASGLSDLEAGLRLRYEFSRKFAPYLGAVYERSSQGAASTGAASVVAPAPASPLEVRGAWRVALGLHAWF